MKPNVSLPCLVRTVACPYPTSHGLNSHNAISFLSHPTSYYFFSSCQSVQNGPIPSASPTKPTYESSCLPCVPHVQPISSCSILSSYKYFLRRRIPRLSTHFSNPRYFLFRSTNFLLNTPIP